MASHYFNTDMACSYGVTEAILIQHIGYWIKENKKIKRNCHEERTWTYNSVTKLCEILPYLTRKQIWAALDHLITIGILLKGRYNQKRYDRTNWYCFINEEKILQQLDKEDSAPIFPVGKMAFPVGKMDIPPKEDGFSPQGEPIPLYTYTNTDDDIAIAEKIMIRKPTAIIERKKVFKDTIDAYRGEHQQLYPITIYIKFFNWWTQPVPGNDAVMRFEAERYFDINIRLQNFWNKINSKDREGFWNDHRAWLMEWKSGKKTSPIKALVNHISRSTQPELFRQQTQQTTT